MRAIRILTAILLILSLAAVASACGESGQGRQADAPGTDVSVHADSAPTGGKDAVTASDPTASYRDGTYEITTDEDLEGYYVKASLTIKDGKITDFHYDIYDSNKGDALFDEHYEDYMPTQHYKQQCRDDLKGMKTYGPKLVETQSVDDVDAVAKATWTWKWFKKAANELLEQAAVK